jgi:hypothetical protein
VVENGACCGMREGISIEVSAADRDRLERIVADRNSPQKHVWRARIILASAAGCGTAEIMRRGRGVQALRLALAGAVHARRRGRAGARQDPQARAAALPPAVVDRVVALTFGDPPGATTHWTGRAMAAASGVSLRSVQRIWAAHGLQPHRVRRFKLSTDPAFAAKLRDVWQSILDHVTRCDFPETAARWLAMGREAGFAGAEQRFVAPTDLYSLFAFQAGGRGVLAPPKADSCATLAG